MRVPHGDEDVSCYVNGRGSDCGGRDHGDAPHEAACARVAVIG